jgi:hypothetical protein
MRYEAAINYFFLVLFSIANDSQLFFLMDTCIFLAQSGRVFFSESNNALKVIMWSIAK